MDENARDRAVRMDATLREALAPLRLEILDESHLHAGHAGAAPGGQTHYAVEAVSDAFVGLSRIDRHRLVHAALSEEFERGLHALRLKLLAPGED